MRPPSAFLRVGVPAWFALFAISLQTGCNDRTNPASPDVAGQPVTPPSSVAPPEPRPMQIDGHYRGVAESGNGSFRYYAEFLLTNDGQVRFLVSGPGETSGIESGAGLPANLSLAPESMQFVGNVRTDGAEAFGNGVLIDENCAGDATGRFCGATVPASVHLTGRWADWYVALSAELTLDVDGTEETWLLDLAEWSIYYHLPSVAPDGTKLVPAGIYIARFAPFSRDGDTTISVDGAGNLFFQSAGSGCVGNGALVPHAEGHRYVFDVSLVIESCDAAYAVYNREYSGLATSTQDGAWSYDDWLVMFLSASGDSGAPVGVTTIASYDYGSK